MKAQFEAIAAEIERCARPRTLKGQAAAPNGAEREQVVAGLSDGLAVLAAAWRQGMHSDDNAFLGSKLRSEMAVIAKCAMSLAARFEGRALSSRLGLDGSVIEVPDQDTWARVAEVMKYVDLGGDTAFAYWSELLPILHDLADRATRSANFAPVGPGSRRPDPQPDKLSTQQLCALTIYEGWSLLNPDEPAGKHDDAAALDVAATYWAVCGGSPIGNTPESTSAWRAVFGSLDPASFGKADMQNLDLARRAIRSHLLKAPMED